MHPEPPPTPTGLDADEPAVAHRGFGLARGGSSGGPAAHVDADLLEGRA